jgi:hypothetical protein
MEQGSKDFNMAFGAMLLVVAVALVLTLIGKLA